MSVTEHISYSGPVFDGRAAEDTRRMIEAINDQMAQKALDKARNFQIESIRVEHTGAEPASLHVESSEFGRTVTDNNAIVYGPWLEGTGSRNLTTRFKGYHAMRRAYTELEAEAEEDANRAARPYIDEMNS